MLKLLQKIRNSMKYAGLKEHEMKACEKEAKKRNAESLQGLLPSLIILLFILLVISYIPNTGEASNQQIYLAFLIIMIILHLAYEWYFSKNVDSILVLVYLFMITTYSFGIIQATMLGPDCSSTAFCLFLVAVPILIYDSPFRIDWMSFWCEVILIVSYLFMQSTVGDKFVLINSIFSTVLSILCCYTIQKTKYSEIYTRLLIENQRDTDSLTGAKSRIAYILDLKDLCQKHLEVGVIYADVNGLKATNDTLGHEAGDKLIQKAFNLMLKHFNKDDRIYRIGGDEFVIICVDNKPSFEKRFDDLVNDEDNNHLISCGKAWLNKIENVEDSIKQAEKMMYADKTRFYHEHPESSRYC